ncbi:MAG: phage terminase large subunit [Lachnospiraceae bacterium]|nr:phage terminase large subunit [Lachnospiraceae bacterium]
MVREIKPQRGPQEKFLATCADIAIYGGAAGGGKTYALLMEPLRYMNVLGYRAVIYRNQFNQINSSGGLWDESTDMYQGIPGAVGARSPKYHWTFRNKASLYFDFLHRDDDVYKWQGAQITFIGFDELTHFSENQFFYMLSRNRSICGVRPYVRATCNPDADSWVAEFIKWWIDPDTGYPIQERSGKIRWMVRLDEVIYWFDTKQDAVNAAIDHGIDHEKAAVMAKSVTFIASTLQDNKILMRNDPGYMANLLALPLVERERLLYGNWKIKAAAGLMFKRTQVTMVEQIPKDVILWCRGWDLAATSEDEKGNPAYTAGVLIGKRRNGRYIVADVINKRLAASEVRKLVLMTAQADRAAYGRVVQRLPQDPGQAGKDQAQSYMKLLSGFIVKIMPESGDKVTRAEPFSAMWQGTETMEIGFVDVLIAAWNGPFFNQYESFPQSDFKDMVDAGSSSFNEIENGRTYSDPPTGGGLNKSSYWR